jgi:hypothetical protein
VCPACGIAYQKYLERQTNPQPRTVRRKVEAEPSWIEPYKARLLELPAQADPKNVYGRMAAWCVFTLWGCWFALHGVDAKVIGSSFLHLVNLPFHEFGHLFFRPFGRFMAILGGSLFQVLMPLGLMGVFIFKQRDNFAASLMLWWAGQSMVDLTPYIADAPYRALPLIGGGGEEGHDWGNLLTMTGLLNYSTGISRLCFTAGVLVMIAALVWGAKLLRGQYALMKGQT